MRRSTIAVLAVAIAVVLGFAFFPRVSCNKLPRFEVIVNGVAPESKQISGGGNYCGTSGHGTASNFLEPISTPPGASVSVTYTTGVRWNRVTYSVSQDEQQVVSQGPLRGKQDAFALPDVPGTYQVSIAYRWNGWLPPGHAEGSTYFRVQVQAK